MGVDHRRLCLEGLAFSPVHVSCERVFSHHIRFERGRYRVNGADLGAFATLAAAEQAGSEGGSSFSAHLT